MGMSDDGFMEQFAVPISHIGDKSMEKYEVPVTHLQLDLSFTPPCIQFT